MPNKTFGPNVVSPSRPIHHQNSLHMPVQYMSGVGPHRAEILSKLNIHTVEDLLFHYPREHQDRQVCLISKAVLKTKAAIQGEIQTVQFRRIGPMLGQARIVLKDSSGQIEAIWFKRMSFKFDVFSRLKKDLEVGRSIFLFGAMVSTRHGKAMRVEHYDLELQDGSETMHTNRIVPIYPLTDGIREPWFRELMTKCVNRYSAFVDEILPKTFLAEQKLIPLSKALLQYHFPKNLVERDQARERLAFDEFFFLELVLELSRQNRKSEEKGFDSVPSKKLLTPFKHNLGYEFTKAQVRCINEIFRDMANPIPMNRLLQGDVGSGKTVVALSAALLSVGNKRQVALLAPTEILASQHVISMKKMLSGLSVKIALLTRSTPSAERKKILADLKSGKIDILIGTHAILNESVQFKELGLVVIDEQHRFGVRQRARLAQKNKKTSDAFLLDQFHPDVLIMTATPIPRTLALTLYGDLDVSVIDEMPSGRQKINTLSMTEKETIQSISNAVKEGRQAFVVFPLIEESEAISQRSGKVVKAAKKEYERLKQYFPDNSVSLLHGAMKADEKKAVMDEFREGKTSILVSTPVIEVGIDVPNATHMAIVNPERFGLAQLHQLRGRVGRGQHASTCILVRDEVEEGLQQRLDIFCNTFDGFRLAEEDLKLRGPGEIVGEAQHGVPLFRVGNIVTDALLISRSREAAKLFVEGKVSMTYKESQMINKTLHKRFSSKIQLTQIG